MGAPTSPRLWLPLLLLLVLGLPLSWSAAAAAWAGDDVAAWRAVLTDASIWRSLAMSLWTGLTASGLSVLLTAWILQCSFPGPAWSRLVRMLGPMLAVPHAAFGIGLALLVAPSGWLLRLVSPWATGFTDPPAWSTTQDPWGLGLIAVLVAKEVPFLLWTAASHLQRPDVAARLEQELHVARSMGYAPRRAWRYVLWPQLWPRLRWPMRAVLAYSLTVVDVALVIGPASPPTLSMLAWRWLLDADLRTNAQGAAAAWLLAALLCLVAWALWHAAHLSFWSRGRMGGKRGSARVLDPLGRIGRFVLPVLVAIYLAVLLALAVGSLSGVWAFPALLPQSLSLQSWQAVWGSMRTVSTTATLGIASAISALLWSVAWLETAPPGWDAALRRLIYLPLMLPSIVWTMGLHDAALRVGLDGRFAGLWIAHALACVPYVLITLSPAYAGFDRRYRMVAASLGRSRAAFLWQVKWPLLRASLLAALAVGFAVSVAQYLPTVFVGAGRFATVTTEAVTLASGGQRSLTSAYAGLQFLLPALAFALAAWAGRKRRFRPGITPSAAEPKRQERT